QQITTQQMTTQQPFTFFLNQFEARIEGVEPLVRRLSSLRGQFLDQSAFDAILAQGDPMLYKVYAVDRPGVDGELSSGLTILHPGKVGDEYFMTKGHFHAVLETGEVYYCLGGRGMMVMETPEGDWHVAEMTPGAVVYVPPRWAHRSVNVSIAEDLVFFWVYPANAGHDYGAIERQGFRKLIVAQEGAPAIVDNPRWLPPAQR
ncbi:glucose-6-phosphate isomerase, partial [Caldilinea sp.]|uniref:glucose-6-phosphate isomerase n=1 Tax=Caldilinea sp. TaxID=2293560 RepID=UPI0031CCA4A1